MSSASPVDSFDATGPSGETKPADSPIEIYRHSSAHLLEAAVTELFPDAQCGIGPPTADGFFYDFLGTRPFTPEDLEAIEKRMPEIAKQDRPIEKKLIPKREALDLFASKGQALKCELIREKAGDVVQCYTMGGFIDFCLGPHLPSTGHIKAFKLNPSPAAAYWKGREGNPSMQRIYGYAFFTKEELDRHLFRLEEAKRRDHRKLGRELDLFSIAGETGRGLVLSTKPETASGTDEQWGVGTAALRKALETRGLGYQVDPGEGVFYGPKIDIKIKDSLDRAWQCSTIQVDFHNPERFRLEYIGEDGRAHPPGMGHRAPLRRL